MIDDLLTRGVTEPYRMFTTRSEYRVTTRADNADLRLTRMARDAGIVSDKRWRHFTDLEAQIKELQTLLEKTRFTCTAWKRKGFNPSMDGSVRSAIEILSLSGISVDSLIPHIEPRSPSSPAYTPSSFAPTVRTRVGIEARYSRYLKHQERMARKFQNEESVLIPRDLDYSKVGYISTEERQALEQVRPANVGMARRIEGVTPEGWLKLLMHVQMMAGGRGRVRRCDNSANEYASGSVS